jgi:hypothetical protein
MNWVHESKLHIVYREPQVDIQDIPAPVFHNFMWNIYSNL